MELTNQTVLIRAALTLYGNGLTIFGRDSGRFEIRYDGQIVVP